MPLALHRVIVFVASPLKCAAFYQKHFGLKPVGELTDEWAELSSPKGQSGARLAFHSACGPKGRINKPTGSPNNPHKIVFYTKNVKAERARLLKSGINMEKLWQYEGIEFCDGKDCENHPFQISSRK
jgi:catechol 2,3-dioxygenase-like lactoylglutathione lyase family enzyme